MFKGLNSLEKPWGVRREPEPQPLGPSLVWDGDGRSRSGPSVDTSTCDRTDDLPTDMSRVLLSTSVRVRTTSQSLPKDVLLKLTTDVSTNPLLSFLYLLSRPEPQSTVTAQTSFPSTPPTKSRRSGPPTSLTSTELYAPFLLLKGKPVTPILEGHPTGPRLLVSQRPMNSELEPGRSLPTNFGTPPTMTVLPTLPVPSLSPES